MRQMCGTKDRHIEKEKTMKKRLLSLALVLVLVAGLLTGCDSKATSGKVTCPWAPSGVAGVISQ